MKTEIKLTVAQRQELARIFKNMLRDEKMYDAWGPAVKGLYEQTIEWYFVPFKANDLPAIECEQREVTNDKREVIDVIYKFKLDLVFPFAKELRRSILLEKEMKKAAIDGIV